MSSFAKTLQRGRIGEGLIAKWLNAHGYHVLPAYEIEIEKGKGPRLFTAAGNQLITPDLLIFNQAKTIMWIEAKTKTAFTFYRRTRRWQDGIDRKHWLHYVKVADLTEWPLWLFFLHPPGPEAKDTPPGMFSPRGLFGQDVKILRGNIEHESERWADGMVYWNRETLKVLSSWPLILEPTRADLLKSVGEAEQLDFLS